MKSAEQRFEQIEQYLQGRLPADEARAFEAALAADPELAALVQQHRLERQGLEVLVERDLLAKMQAWDRETEIFQQLPKKTAGARPFAWLLRAAAVLTLAVFGYWLLQQSDTTTPEAAPPVAQTKPEIKPRVPTVRTPKPALPRRATPAPAEEPAEDFAQNDQPEPTPAPIEEMTATAAPDYAALAGEFFRERDFLPPKGSKGGQAGSPAYNQALEQYQDGKYNDVISKVKPGLTLGTDALQQKELLALSLYQRGRYSEAIPYFSEIISSRKQPYAQRAEWGLTLALLHQMPAKKPLFDRVFSGILNNPEHLFYTQARRLEERLK